MSVIRLAAHALAFATLTIASQQVPTPRFASEVTAVRLDVFVDGIASDDATRLAAQDFEVRDEGIPQRISLIDVESMPINVVLLLDATLSTAGEPLRRLSEAVRAVTSRLDDRDRVGLLVFRDLVTGVVPLTTDRQKVNEALSEVRGFGRTGLYDAIVAGLAVSESARGRTLLLVVSDGTDNTSFLTREAVEQVLRGSEVVVHAVSTAQGPSLGVPLDWISQPSGGQSFRIRPDGGMADTFLRILDRFRRRHLIVFYPAPDARPRWPRLQVKLKGKSGRVRHRSGYWSVVR
jgi:VWFA-related protein